MKVNLSVPITTNPLEIKDRMLELQNLYPAIMNKYLQAKLKRDSLETALSLIRDQAYLKMEEGTVEQRKTKSKVIEKIEVTYIDIEEDKTKYVTENMTYHECKYKLVLAEASVSGWWLEMEELKSAIEVCKYYPMKGL